MAKGPFVIPAEIRRKLGTAPVLSTEDPKRFEELLTFVAQRYPPNDALEWFWVWDQTVARWNRERLTRYENQVHESLPKKALEKAEQARAKQAEEEYKARALDRILGDGRGTGLPSDTPILSGLPLQDAKERLLSRLLRRPDFCRWVERNGITRDHFRDNPEWQEIFDLVRSGQDIQAFVDKNPSSETARLWRLAEQMRAGETLALARQIVASVRADEAAMVTAAREATQAAEPDDPADKPVAMIEPAAELDYASGLPDVLRILLDLGKLTTAELKRFDMVPTLIAFTRECRALNLHEVNSDPLEVEFKDGPIVVEADQLPATSSTVRHRCEFYRGLCPSNCPRPTAMMKIRASSSLPAVSCPASTRLRWASAPAPKARPPCCKPRTTPRRWRRHRPAPFLPTTPTLQPSCPEVSRWLPSRKLLPIETTRSEALDPGQRRAKREPG
jgi:hypothetical protein